MYVLESLKLNKFKLVSIPKNRSYFERFGFGACPVKAFSGDEQIPSGSKTDVLQMMEKKLSKDVESNSNDER